MNLKANEAPQCFYYLVDTLRISSRNDLVLQSKNAFIKTKESMSNNPKISAYFQALKAIKQHASSFDGETHEFIKLSLSEARNSLPPCTLLFVKLEQFSPVYLPLGIKPDEWTEKLILAIKRQIKDSGYTTFINLAPSAHFYLAVQSSMITPIESNNKPVGAIAAFSQEPNTFSDADNLFMASFGKAISDKLEQQDIGSVTSRIPAVVMAKKEWEQTVDALGHVICLMDKSGYIKRTNRQIEKWQLGTVQSLHGRTIHQVFHSNCHDYDCSFLHDTNEAWVKMSKNGESHWETEIQATGSLLRFTLRKTSQPSNSKLVGHESFAVLTVSQSSLEDVKNEVSRKLAEKGSDNLAAKEEERRHIAMELHDGIGQDLAVVKINLEGLQQAMHAKLDKKTIWELDQIIHYIRRSMEDVHRLSTDLHPRYLDSRSLPVALELLCRDLGRTYKDVKINCDISSTSRTMSKPLKLAIFRVAQEALSNAFKHSQADAINVKLQHCANQFELNIEDNGIGFDYPDEHENASGLGLAGIRERVKLSDGSVTITTNASKGTTISAKWPEYGSHQIAQSD